MKGQAKRTEKSIIQVEEIQAEVLRKQIKHLHIKVYVHGGKVSVSAPLHLDDQAIRLAVEARLSWIRKQQQKFAGQEHQSTGLMLTGEKHYFQGRPYFLNLFEGSGPPRIMLNGCRLELLVPSGTDAAGRWRVLDRWYRKQLRARFPVLLRKWEPLLGVRVAQCRIKRMKTRWGSCNIQARRIWLNLELIKKPAPCLEYLLVHEMAHLLERRHNQRFYGIIDKFLPDWRLRKDMLQQPLQSMDQSRISA